MEQKEPSEFTGQTLLEKSKKRKSNIIINAVFIGFLVGIVIFSILKTASAFSH